MLPDNKSSVPCDILFYILTSLPATSLLRFQSVSTSWNAIIHDKNFSKAHRNQSKALGRIKFLLQKLTTDKERGCGLKPGDEFEFIDVGELEEFSAFNHPIIIEKQLQSPLKGAKVLCSQDCLVLLVHRKEDYCRENANDMYVLWNPSTRQHKTLVCPYLDNNSSELFPYACGLCYDSSTDDYKVILIYISFYVVYSVSNDFWTFKKINLPILEQSLPDISQSFYSDSESLPCCEGISTEEGCVYWSLEAKGRFSTKLDQLVCEDSTIIYFDVKSEELKELPRPGFVGDDEGFVGDDDDDDEGFVGDDDDEEFSLSTLKGCLSLTTIGTKSDIWIMEQDGIWKWFTKLSFEENGKLLFCKGNGEVIFLRPEHHLSVHNLKQKRHFTTFYVSGEYDYVKRLIDLTCLDTLCFLTVNNSQEAEDQKATH